MATTFDHARRRSAFRRLANAERELLPLEEATERLKPFERRHVGLRTIAVAQIVGTEGRATDFDRDFLPRRPEIGPRWRRVEEAFPEGDFPPIVVYLLGDAYFVIDGHHRVAIARQRGTEMIDADVTELRARWHLPANADIVELIHAQQERIFMEDSGLDRALPQLRLRVSRPSGYLELLENIQIHGYHLMLDANRVLERGEIARHWYETQFRPAGDAIRDDRGELFCRNATDADLFLWAYRQRRELVPERGCFALAEVPAKVRERKNAQRGLRALVRPLFRARTA